VGKYILRRLLATIPTLVLLSIFVFGIMPVMPGDVAMLILGGPDSDQTFTEEQLQEVRESLGLERPLVVQYVSWIEDVLFRGGGQSLWTREPVYNELANRMPLTIQLTIGAILIAHVIAIPAGLISALRQNSVADHSVRLFAIMGLAIPNFWLATHVTIINLGYAITFETYSSFLALPTLYLEDLFVIPEARGSGAGRAAFRHLAAEALRRGCGRMEWAVLDWNALAIGFYERLGAQRLSEWYTYRLTADQLRGIAEERSAGV
jgi:ABC-type dipeptide/oligopeptide/nickel transport system permease component